MKKYEVMFIIKPDLLDEEKKNLFNQINDVVTKNNGTVTQANIWSEKRKLFFSIKKYQEGIFYLLNFNAQPDAIVKIRHAYKLNENILRMLITVRE
jgi:small subunit ribosomal protein S6